MSDDDAPAPPRRLSAVVVELADATHDIRIVRLSARGRPLAFRAGQYASVAFAKLPARDYSMANRPDDPVLEFHIRRLGEVGASSYAARELRIGDRVRVAGPYGNAWLRRSHRGPILAAAGGSGLAPLKSIVESALKAGKPRPIRLYFAAREERDIYLETHFGALQSRYPNFAFVPVLSRPGARGRRSGPIEQAIAADWPHPAGAKAYLAGPPAMVEAVTETLRRAGMPAKDIHADPFYTEAEKAACLREAGASLRRRQPARRRAKTG